VPMDQSGRKRSRVGAFVVARTQTAFCSMYDSQHTLGTRPPLLKSTALAWAVRHTLAPWAHHNVS
jgi:hypothetical protein